MVEASIDSSDEDIFQNYAGKNGIKPEKFQKNPDMNEFEISGFKLENVNKILYFIYFDSITINKNDLTEIVRLAKMFQLDRLLENVFNYAKCDLNVENVLSIRDLWMFGDNMEKVKICDQFIECNFEEISKLQIFKKIEFSHLTLLMKSNNLVVQDEKKMFEIAIEWLNEDIQTRQQFGQQLMEDVRFPLMSYTFLHQISEYEILQNTNSFGRIIESIHYSKEKKLRIGQNILKTVDITPRKYLNVFANEEELNEHLICIGGVGGGVGGGEASKSIEICSDLGSSWNKFDEIDPGRSLFTSCTYENYIILIGGSGTERLCTKYDPKDKRFIELEPLPKNKDGHVATIINSELFICGGWSIEKSLISLNLKEQNGKWRNRKSSLENRIGSTGCSVNCKFYVFGGYYSNSCEYYCPQENHWRPLPKMKEKRCLAGSCYDNNKFIYVIGGQDYEHNIYLTTMERFDVQIGQWLTLKSSIGVGRRGLTLTMFKNQLILIGGEDKDGKCHKTTQKYDSILDSEKFRENPDLNKFEISGFKLENVIKIFDFFYSDSITIHKDDLNEIVRLAKIFQLDRVLENVFNYAKYDFNVENILSIRDLWMSCDNMEEVKICDEFIEYYFEEISKLPIFKKIEFPYLTLLMKSNNLIVQDEKRIFDIVVEWVNADIQTRQQFGQQLLEDVKFPLMPYEFLLQISDHEIIHKKSFRRITESIHYSHKKEFRIDQNILKSFDITPRKYLNVFAKEEELNEHLICIGGNGEASKSIEMCSDLGKVNCMSSEDDMSNSCEYYCPQEDHWRPLPEMKEERWCAGSCYDNNKFIYVVGGQDTRNYIYLTSMERFDVEIGQWLTLKSSIGVGRWGLTLTIFKNQLILIGGQDKDNKCHKTIQKYDSILDS
ncbi:Kelch-like protein 8 [Nymphon striatum]|nr:Kelch-like protein 8 [Nymphon striatum]